jgi:DNA-binding MarR family transcriptional regulator
MVTSGTMTNRLDRLEELGLITRTQDPNDGRGILVTLTKTGAKAVDSAMEDLLNRERELLKVFTKNEQSEIANLLRELLQELSLQYQENQENQVGTENPD